MKECPILFSAPMVRAILDGSKTQTRRVVKPQPTLATTDWHADASGTGKWMASGPSEATGGTRQTWPWTSCQYGKPGDRLWVRETWAASSIYDGVAPRDIHPGAGLRYAATDERNGIKDRPSIHMPRWASRILLELTGVRVERLQDISEADAIAEGIEGCDVVINGRSQGKTWRDYGLKCDDPCEWFACPIRSYKSLWEKINGAGSWAANPWVWVVEFKRVETLK